MGLLQKEVDEGAHAGISPASASVEPWCRAPQRMSERSRMELKHVGTAAWAIQR